VKHRKKEMFLLNSDLRHFADFSVDNRLVCVDYCGPKTNAANGED